MTSFSISDRGDNIQSAVNNTFDLLIIGGGITGAGIALDAASRGLKTILVEKHDFAYGTSSRSTKLIHGGLRYLKQLEFGLVKEVGSERAVVHKLAPHLVIPEKMLLPLYEKRGFGSLLTSMGLKLYDNLAGVKIQDQRRMLTRSQTLSQEPLLAAKDVKGGAIYAEYRTDDARLTIEIIKKAHELGAVIINYCSVLDFIYTDGKVSGVVSCDLLSMKEIKFHAHIVVSATGPWVDELREINKSKNGKKLHLTKGVHIVVPHGLLPIHQAIYFDVQDGRMIFAIPRGRTTYIGTTDTNYTGNIDEVRPSLEDITYLLSGVNQTFQEANLTLADIESSWAGLRPLIHEEGKSSSELSRKDEIFESPTGLISIAGGKLTGYRKMAERVVDKVIRFFPNRTFGPCLTSKISLAHSEFKDYSHVQSYIAEISFVLRKYGLEDEGAYLVASYGKQTSQIVRHLETNFKGDEQVALALAELWFCFHFEMVVDTKDFFVRRTGLLYFNIPRLKRILVPVLKEFKIYFKWSEEKWNAELKSMEVEIDRVRQF